MTMNSIEAEIAQALGLAGEPAERIAEIAPLMANAIRTLPIEHFRIEYVAMAGLISPEYTFGPTKHSINNAISAKIASSDIDGSFLHRGKLLRLAQATWFGEFFVPHIWHNPEFRKKLALSTQHLATVEEMIWMGGFWHTSIEYQSVVADHRMLGKTKNVDWRFRCTTDTLSKWLNMEVKRRDADLEQLCPGGERLSKPFVDISQKFSTSSDDEINVATITLYGSDSEQIAIRANNWLRQNPTVDCVVLWNEITATVASTALDTRQNKLEWLHSFLDAPLPHGLVPSVIRHPVELSLNPV